MPINIVVAYDGSAPSQRALDFAVERARAEGAGLIVAHVLEWSPYSFLTPQELEERHARRQEELSRAERAILEPVLRGLVDTGVTVESRMRYGNVVDTLIDIARETGASRIVLGRSGQSSMRERIFGSVAGNLAQVSPVPCTIVP